MKTLAAFLALVSAALLAPSCGYHVGGRAELVPRNIKTIAIPAFGNGTERYRLAALLPADLTREFISRTRYNIVADPGQADAVLTGSLVHYSAYPTTSDPDRPRATSAQVIVNLNLTLTDRHTGKVLYSQVGLEFRDRYEVSIDPKVYFDESGTAVERLSRDVARKVVTDILEAF